MYVIRNGLVFPMTGGGAQKLDILVDGGKIARMGECLPACGEELDAAGLCVTPGFVDAHSHLGGFGTGIDDADLNEITNPLTPELDAYYGVNPDSEDFTVALRQGITTSCVVPGSANVVCGWGMVIKSAGKDRYLLHPAVMKGAMGINPKGCYSPKNQVPMTRMAIANLMKTYLRNVQEYMRKKAAAGDDESKRPPFDLGLEHGIPVLEKKLPMKVHSYMHDMMTVLEIAREFDIEVTIDHALGASDFLDELTDSHVRGVIFGPTGEPLFPGEGGKLDPGCLKALDDRGVKVAVMTDTPCSAENSLLYEMGEAIRWGMDPVRALAMVTSSAAAILGVEDRVGSLAPGRDADILLWRGQPGLTPGAVLCRTILDGETVYQKA